MGGVGEGAIGRVVNSGFWLVGFQVAKPSLNMNPGTCDSGKHVRLKESPLGAVFAGILRLMSFHLVTVGLLVFSRRNMCQCVHPKLWSPDSGGV